MASPGGFDRVGRAGDMSALTCFFRFVQARSSHCRRDGILVFYRVVMPAVSMAGSLSR